MGKIAEIFNFDNIGEKIKNLAKWSCWITILLIWVLTPILLIVLIVEDAFWLWWIPVFGAIVVPIIVWVSSWAIYAFGEFVEDTHAMRKKLSTLENIVQTSPAPAVPTKVEAKKETVPEVKKEVVPETKKEAPHEVPKSTPFAGMQANVSDSVWVCEKCNTKNLKVRSECWSCGAPHAKQSQGNSQAERWEAEIRLLTTEEIQARCENTYEWSEEYRALCQKELKKRDF